MDFNLIHCAIGIEERILGSKGGTTLTLENSTVLFVASSSLPLSPDQALVAQNARNTRPNFLLKQPYCLDIALEQIQLLLLYICPTSSASYLIFPVLLSEELEQHELLTVDPLTEEGEANIGIGQQADRVD